MTRLQTISILSAVLLFVLLYFVFDTKPKDPKSLDKSSLKNDNSENGEELKLAKSKLTNDSILIINSLESELMAIGTDSSKAEVLKKLSGWWYRNNQFLLAGNYAVQVAEIEKSDAAWAISGTTYLAGIHDEGESKRKVLVDKAIKSFENAISIDPENVAHQVNLAMCYADHPPADNPMKGIQMLLELSKAKPEENLVQFTLARLAIKTGQFDKAIGRLTKILAKEPNNNTAHCMLLDIYNQTGDHTNAALHQNRCK